MALIKCPECKKKVSEKCGKCPHCGYPIEIKVELSDNNIEINEKNSKAPKPINQKILIAIISAIIVFVAIGGVVGYNALLPRITATREFEIAVDLVKQKNIELETAITESEELILKKQPLLDESLISVLENTISGAKAVKVTDFQKPKAVEDIIARTKELNIIDYTDAVTKLSDKQKEYEISAKRYQLVNVPTEAYVIQCLETIPEITGISAVTEDNDPNGNLNKLGGYTATVYFSHKEINLDKSVYGNTIIEQGTDGGGAIEVYTCVEDAIKRRDYLAIFDGTVTASGTHTVIGTVLVRTSNELTASQQKELEAKLIDALTYLPEIDGEKDVLKEETESETIEQTNTPQKDNAPTRQDSTKEPTNSQTTYPSAVGTYYYVSDSGWDHQLFIYDDGTLFMDYYLRDENSPYADSKDCPLEGTWTQNEDTITYSVWATDGFMFNNPFSDTVYNDGIDFLGDYYKRQ